MIEKKFSDVEIHAINYILINEKNNNSPIDVENIIKSKVDSIIHNPNNIKNFKIFSACESDSDIIVNNYIKDEDYTFDQEEYKNFQFLETTLDEIASNLNNPKNQVFHVEFIELPESLINEKKIFESFNVNINLKNNLNKEIFSVKFDKEFDLLKEKFELDSYLGFSDEEIEEFFKEMYIKQESFKYDINLKIKNNFYESNLHSNGYCDFKDDLIKINNLSVKVFDKKENYYKIESNLKNYELNLDNLFDCDIREEFPKFNCVWDFLDLNLPIDNDYSFGFF